MQNIIEYKQASSREKPGCEEVYVLNQSYPVYVKKEALLTGDDILSVDAYEDELNGNVINIELSPKGMNLINMAAKDKDFPMLVFFVNQKSIEVIHKIYELEKPEIMMITNEDKDFTIALTELIRSGLRNEKGV